MKYPSYKKYSKIEVKSIGTIPIHWKAAVLKRIFRIYNGSTPQSGNEKYWDGDIVWLTPDDLGRNKKKYIYESHRRITAEGYRSCGTQMVPVNSIIISSRAPIGHIAINNLEACTNQGCKSLVPIKKDVSSDFYYYFLLISKYDLQSLGKGSTFMELSGSLLGKYIIPIPPYDEQQSIANFLDQETARIDALIEKKQKLIQLLKEKRTALITKAVTKGLNPDVKMKESGIDWLGEMPEHWEVKKLKYISKIVIGKMLTPTDKGGSLQKPYLRAQNLDWINPNIADIKNMWFTITELSKYRVKRNDLLVSEGGEVGRTCIWSDELSEVYIQNSVNKVTIEQGNPYYYLFLLYALGQYGFFDAIVSRVSIGHLTKEKLKEIFIIAPPYDEQVRIVEH
ncbi:MAG: restriction endonuclease subunit S, partial [Bacteroidales bacterium]|nr:restriction endonuclease subunit S [Bacteroidales bacterium]